MSVPSMQNENNAQLTTTDSDGLVRVGESLKITNKILASIRGSLTFWNSLDNIWKAALYLNWKRSIDDSYQLTYFSFRDIHAILANNQHVLYILTLEEINMILGLNKLYIFSPLPNLNPLSKFPNLARLTLNQDNQITDITLLAQLPNLTELTLKGSQITDIRPLAQLTNLWKLCLSHTKITGITPLAQLTKLQHLFLSYTKITDITPLAQLTNLRALFLQSNLITVINPLVHLNKLQVLNLEDNPIPETEITLLKKALPNCTIKY